VRGPLSKLIGFTSCRSSEKKKKKKKKKRDRKSRTSPTLTVIAMFSVYVSTAARTRTTVLHSDFHLVQSSENCRLQDTEQISNRLRNGKDAKRLLKVAARLIGTEKLHNHGIGPLSSDDGFLKVFQQAKISKSSHAGLFFFRITVRTIRDESTDKQDKPECLPACVCQEELPKFQRDCY
jgi:hypothetical protein